MCKRSHSILQQNMLSVFSVRWKQRWKNITGLKESTQFNIAPESRQVQLYKCHTSRELTTWTDDCKLVKHAGHNFPMNVKEITDI